MAVDTSTKIADPMIMLFFEGLTDLFLSSYLGIIAIFANGAGSSFQSFSDAISSLISGLCFLNVFILLAQAYK